ncbi:hypothetical protein CJF32_00000591 [Rutstroemia sp. NJR-2017a WRK4]|nr:hypothetical protein CJF32_00000591 [Rutstroemia sp. NJR-2017a WRK4]
MASLPSSYNALRFSTLAGPLTIESKPISTLQTASTLLIRVHYASINPVDTQLWRAGIVSVVSGEKGMGRDFSGTIVAIGDRAKGNWSIGDEVFGLLFQAFGQGTFSQYIAVDPASDPVVKKPDSLSHEAAASIPLVALTAFACLDWLLENGSTSQRKVIVRGASGGSGSWVVQLAKLLYDCHVTAVCSGRNAEYVRNLGADEVIDYTIQPVLQTLVDSRASGGEYDLIVDCTQLVHKKGAYVTIVGDKTDVKGLGGPVTYFKSPAQIWRYISGWIWGPRYACVSLYNKSEYLQKVVGLAERGELKVEIQEIIKDALNEDKEGWKRAIELIESARVRGKVVLEIL